MAHKIRADNCVWDLCSINSMSTMYACIVSSLHIICTQEVSSNRTSKTNYVSNTTNFNILEGAKHLHIIFLNSFQLLQICKP